MMWNKLKNNWPLLTLLALHGLVLFYNYTTIPFSHDELSAIERCKFDSFHDLINLGVKPDGHPAGVQLLLWFIIQLFGIHEWILKLPFLIAGLGCLILLYRISETIFSRYAAATTSVFFIFLSYYIAQEVVARPYIPGLFCSLGVFFACLKIKQNPALRYNYILLFLFSIGAFYSHYFSFLQAIVIWILFYAFYSKRMNIKYFLIAIGASLIAFIPHIGITFHHLGMGGLEWLSEPNLQFFAYFFRSYFNNSIPLLIAASSLFILCFLVKQKSRKMRPLLLLLFVLPSAILFIYSILRAPVLQAPALYFCSPFLLLLIGNGINFFNRFIKISLIISLLISNAYILVLQSQFYQLRDYQPMEKFVVTSQNLITQNHAANLLVIWSGNSKYLKYYINKHNFTNNIIITDTLKDFKNIDLSFADGVICNQLPPVIFYELSKLFPFIDTVENNLLYSCMMLTNRVTKHPLYSTPVKLKFNIDTTSEWSNQAYSFRLDTLVNSLSSFVEFVPKIDSSIKGAELVLETYIGLERIDWRSIYLEPNSILSLKVKDVIPALNPAHSIKLYIWKSGKKVKSKPIEVWLYKRLDNPSEYIFQPDSTLGISFKKLFRN